jgi:hypothetical protein
MKITDERNYKKQYFAAAGERLCLTEGRCAKTAQQT